MLTTLKYRELPTFVQRFNLYRFLEVISLWSTSHFCTVIEVANSLKSILPTSVQRLKLLISLRVVPTSVQLSNLLILQYFVLSTYVHCYLLNGYVIDNLFVMMSIFLTCKFKTLILVITDKPIFRQGNV